MLVSILLLASIGQIDVPTALDRAQVLQQVLAHDPEVRHARHELEALTGKRTAAGTLLPSNPVLQMSLGRRSPGPNQPAFETPGINWNVELSQEVEIAGQRGLRLDMVDAESAAQARRLQVAEREAGAAALAAYYQVVAAQRNIMLAARIAEYASALAAAAQSRADVSLIAPLDADVAAAEALRLGLAQVVAERRLSIAQATLAALLGREDDIQVYVSDDLSPLPKPPTDGEESKAVMQRAFRFRAEMDAANQETRVLTSQLHLLRRQRVPNLTVSLYASQDSTAERVIGGGIALPLPLPGPVGQTFAGQIAETLARIEQSKGDVATVRRRVRLEIMDAITDERMANRSLALFTPRQVDRAQENLTALSDAVAARQLTVRDAILSQRSLIELLQSHLETQLQHAIARVELTRACGLPLDGVDP